jgi:hypothetical protein
VPALLSSLDLGSTLLALAGGGPLGDGVSFAPLLAGSALPERAAYSEGLAYGYELQTLVDPGGFKLIRAGREGERDLLFDLGTDPLETRDLSAAEPERARALRAQIERRQAALAARRAAQGALIQGVGLERLQELGYAGDEADEEGRDGE